MGDLIQCYVNSLKIDVTASNSCYVVVALDLVGGYYVDRIL